MAQPYAVTVTLSSGGFAPLIRTSGGEYDLRVVARTTGIYIGGPTMMEAIIAVGSDPGPRLPVIINNGYPLTVNKEYSFSVNYDDSRELVSLYGTGDAISQVFIGNSATSNGDVSWLTIPKTSALPLV